MDVVVDTVVVVVVVVVFGLDDTVFVVINLESI